LVGESFRFPFTKLFSRCQYLHLPRLKTGRIIGAIDISKNSVEDDYPWQKQMLRLYKNLITKLKVLFIERIRTEFAIVVAVVLFSSFGW
jgi:hypothetical protein